MLELIAKTGLFFGQPLTYAVVVIMGFIFFSEKIFGRALFILLFTMIYNVWLKSIWQIPLPQPLEGWALPSGHMHSAFVFWGWLAIELHKFWFFALIFLVLCFAGYGLLYNVFHYPVDIIAAVGFGALSLLIYYFISKQPYFKDKPYRLGYLLTMLSLIIFGLVALHHDLKPHMWQALGTLIGFSIGWQQLSQKEATIFSMKQKIIAFMIALSGTIVATYAINQLPLSLSVAIFVKFLLIGFWISYSKAWLTRKTPFL